MRSCVVWPWMSVVTTVCSSVVRAPDSEGGAGLAQLRADRRRQQAPGRQVRRALGRKLQGNRQLAAAHNQHRLPPETAEIGDRLPTKPRRQPTRIEERLFGVILPRRRMRIGDMHAMDAFEVWPRRRRIEELCRQFTPGRNRAQTRSRSATPGYSSVARECKTAERRSASPQRRCNRRRVRPTHPSSTGRSGA